MKTSPFLINLIIYGPYVILFILFLIFFYRAIRFYGITRLKKFTAVMLGAFLVAFALRFFKVNFFDWVPVRFLVIAGHDSATNLSILVIMIFFVISISKIRSEKNARFLTANWIVVGLFSTFYVCSLAYAYISFDNTNGIDEKLYTPSFEKIRDYYLQQGIYAFLWVLVAGISLWKIKKEKRRLLYA